jgi:hypothetical protein
MPMDSDLGMVGGRFAVCAQPKLTLEPKTAAAVINMTCVILFILSFMVPP